MYLYDIQWVINSSQTGIKIFSCSFNFFYSHWIDICLTFSILWNIYIWNHECLCALSFGMDINLYNNFADSIICQRQQPKGKWNAMCLVLARKPFLPSFMWYSSIHTECVSTTDHSWDESLKLLLLAIAPKIHPSQLPWHNILTYCDHATSQFPWLGVSPLTFLEANFRVYIHDGFKNY